MASGRFKSTFNMLVMIEKCIDHQKSFVDLYGDLTEHAPSRQSLDALCNAFDLMKEELKSQEQIMRTKPPRHFLPMKMRRATHLASATSQTK